MIKKIYISIGVLFSFFLMFLFGFDKINVLAYSDIESTLGSYPVKLDYENYNFTNNIFDIDTGYYCLPISQTDFEVLDGDVISYSFIDGTIMINNSSAWSGWCSSYIPVEPNTTYTFSASTNLLNDLIQKTAGSFSAYSSNLNPVYGSWLDSYRTSNGWFLQYTTPSNVHYLRFALYTRGIEGVDSDFGPRSYNIIKPQLYSGEEPSLYSIPFKFGYNVHYNVALKNNLSFDIDAGISLYSGNKLLTSSSCYIPANDSEICSSLNNKIYLPFNIDNNGYIGFNHNLTLIVGPVDSITISSGGLAFESVFSAYYKGEETDYLYFKQTYTMNNIFLSGFNVSSNENTNITFVTTDFDKPFNISSNNEYNISTNKKTSVTFTDKFNYNEFITTFTNNIYDFAIVVSNLNNGSNFNISISTLMTRVVGDSGANAPLPGDSAIINKYNECSAWYDIPCQLGNGLTYVIYEAPIISPVLTFIVSFVTMFSSLVSFVDLFNSFGIVFGCFIIYMFIELLHKYSK